MRVLGIRCPPSKGIHPPTAALPSSCPKQPDSLFRKGSYDSVRAGDHGAPESRRTVLPSWLRGGWTVHTSCSPFPRGEPWRSEAGPRLGATRRSQELSTFVPCRSSPADAPPPARRCSSVGSCDR